MSKNLRTIADHIRYAFSRLNASDAYFGHGYESAWDESVHLVLQSLHLPWNFERELWHCALTDDECALLRERIAQRVERRIPVAYLTGEAWFCGLRFSVNEDVLVPRSPIAELIEQQFSPWLRKEPLRVLDICTGSACIAIALAYAFGDAEIDAVDLSPAALDVAAKNVSAHELEERVTLWKSDGCAALLAENVPAYDLIVSNPPYVDADDMRDLPAEYLHEPRMGLEAGADGLDLVHRLLAEAAMLLADGGLLVMEVGNSWPALEASYPETAFTWVEFEQGGHGVFVMTAEELRAMPLRVASEKDK